MVCPEGKLSPVFYQELSYEHQGDAVIIQPSPSKLQLNPYIFSQNGFSYEEIVRIKQDVETQGFISAVSSVYELFHVEQSKVSSGFDTKPLKHTITPTLVNKAILYFGERTGITHNLIVELRQLQRKPLDELASTSLLLLIARTLHPEKDLENTKPLLEVFLLNSAQQQAVHQALTKSLTVITGPPGTGKSQVVLNIIANAVYQKKTVLFASKNNKAVDVVIDKFHAILPYKLIVRMGHRTHRKNAKNDLTQLIKEHLTPRSVQPQITSDLWSCSSQIQKIQDDLARLSSLNQTMDMLQNTIVDIIDEFPVDVYEEGRRYMLDRIDTHMLMEDIKKHFDQHGFFRRLGAQKQQRIQEHCFNTYFNLLPSDLINYLKHQITTKNIPYDTILRWIFNWKKIEHTNDDIQHLKKDLLTIPDYRTLKTKIHALHERYLALSRPVLETHWLNTLACLSEEDKHSVLDYFHTSEQLEAWTGDPIVFRQLLNQQIRTMQHILRFLPVWVVTNLSAKHSFPLKANLFDILIIDEASQCDIASALPLFHRAKQVVIIGDPNQLSHISLLTEVQDRTLAVQHGLAEEWYHIFSYTKHSLYGLAARIGNENKNQPVLLNEHYRCHSDIISFSNEFYYERKLTIATDESRLLVHPALSAHISWFPVKGKTVHAQSPYNTEEAEKVVEEILKILGTTTQANASLGVVTLFRAQTEMIAEKLQAFQDVYDTRITIGTAHKFQGDEKDIIVFSPAVSEGVKPGTLHWIETTNQLLNVAVTRSRSYLMIIGDKDTCAQSIGPLNHLAEYVETRTPHAAAFESPLHQRFYEALKNQGVPITTHYIVPGKPPVHLDFAFFVNGCRYVLEITNKHKTTHESRLREDGWRIRRYCESDIMDDLPSVIEEIKRLC